MIRFYNGKTLRFEPALRVTDEEVWVEGGRIAYEFLAEGKEPPYNTDSGSMCVTVDNIDVYMDSLMQ